MFGKFYEIPSLLFKILKNQNEQHEDSIQCVGVMMINFLCDKLFTFSDVHTTDSCSMTGFGVFPLDF